MHIFFVCDMIKLYHNHKRKGENTMKRIMALLLATVMIFTFVACSGGGNGEDKSTPTPAPGTDATPTGAEVDYTEGGKYLNFPGANGDDNLKLPALQFMSNEFTLLTHDAPAEFEIDRFVALRDAYGLTRNVIVVAASDRVTKFVASVMGGESPDMFNYAFLPSLINKGYCAPWDDYVDFSLGLWDELRASMENVKFKGHYYTIGTQASRWNSLIYYNTEIFDELALKTPKEYYDEGDWNWNTMRELARQATVDADGDGSPEIYGFACGATPGFYYSAGKALVEFSDEGAVNNMKSAEVARAMQFYTDLVVNDGSTLYGSDFRKEFGAGQIAMYCAAGWYCFSWGDMMLNQTVELVPFPKDPESDVYYVHEGFGSYVMGANSANPYGAAAQIYSTLYDKYNTQEEIEKTSEERIEEGGWSNEIDDMIMTMCYSEDKVPVLTTWEIFELGEFWGDIWFGPHLGEPWSVIAEEVAPQIDEKIRLAFEE